MKNNIDKKNLIMIGAVLVAIVAVVVIVLVVGKGGKDNTKKPSESDSNVVSFEKQKVEGLNISGFNMLYEDGITNVIAVIQNATEADMYVRVVNVALIDEKGNQVGSAFFYVDETLKPGVEASYTAYADGDITSKAKGVKYTIEK